MHQEQGQELMGQARADILEAELAEELAAGFNLLWQQAAPWCL